MKGRHFWFGIFLLKYPENISSLSVRHSDRGSVWNIASLDLKYPARPAGVGRLSKHCKAFIFILALSVYSGCFHFFILSVEAGGTGRGEVRLPAPPRSSKYQNTSPSLSLSSIPPPAAQSVILLGNINIFISSIMISISNKITEI